MMDANQKINILIGTPCYNGLLHQDYVAGLIEYFKRRIPISVMHIGNESLITKGRNTIISFFYHHINDFTHLLFLDADVYLSGEALYNMIYHDLPVVAAPVPMKGQDENGNPIYNISNVISKEIDKETGLIEVERVGTAAFLMKSSVVELLVEDAKSNNKKYLGNPFTRGHSVSGEHYDVFK